MTRNKFHLIALAALAVLPGFAHARNDGPQTIEAMQDRLINLNQASQNIINAADAAGRDFTTEEQTQLDDIAVEFEGLEASIARRQRVENMGTRTSAPGARRTTPELEEDVSGAGGATNAGGAGAGAGGAGGVPRTAVRASMPAQPRDNRDVGKNGFLSMGDYLRAVVNSCAKGANVDPRLTRNAAPGAYGSEGTGADGGFAVPPDFRQTIMTKVMGEDALLPLTDNQTTSSNGMTYPADETTPWQTSGGIQAYWDGEGEQKTPSKPALVSKSVKMNKIIALVPLTDELLEDAPAMASYVQRKAPEKINYKVNEAIIRGTGVGMPLGILASPGTVTVPAEGAQAADTVVFNNIIKLWSALTPAARRGARWYMNPDVEAQLLTMQFPGTGTAVPAYLPPGGLSQSPYGTLLGRPVMPQEAASALGDVGDIIFGDLKNYLTVTKQGGIRTDTSIHIWFDFDITAFRFVLRVGGEPWWNATVTPAQAGGSARGFFATLAARA